MNQSDGVFLNGSDVSKPIVRSKKHLTRVSSASTSCEIEIKPVKVQRTQPKSSHSLAEKEDHQARRNSETEPTYRRTQGLQSSPILYRFSLRNQSRDSVDKRENESSFSNLSAKNSKPKAPKRERREHIDLSDDFSDATGPLLASSHKDLLKIGTSFSQTLNGHKSSGDSLSSNQRYEQFVQMSKEMALENDIKMLSPFNNNNLISVRSREMILAIGLLCFLAMSLGLVLIIVLEKINAQDEAQAQCFTKGCLRYSSDALFMVDSSHKPCENFFLYACGGWLASRHISTNEEMLSVSTEAQRTVDLRLREILEGRAVEDDVFQLWKARIMYSKCMDNRAVEETSAGIKKLIEKLGGWPEADGWKESQFQVTFNELWWMWGVTPFFQVRVVHDTESNNKMILQIDENGLAAATERVYNDEVIKQAYRELMIASVLHFGAAQNDASELANKTIEFEKRLVLIHKNEGVRRNISDQHHRVTIQELREASPKASDNIDWLDFLQRGFGNAINENSVVLISDKMNFSAVSSLINGVSKKILTYYMLWKLVYNHILDLPNPMAGLYKNLRKVLEGRNGTKPRWQHCIQSVSEMFTEIVAAEYAKRFLPRHHKLQPKRIVKDIQSSLVRTIRNSEWLSNTTKFLALNKLQTMRMMVGYPDFILNKTVLLQIYLNFSVNDNDSYLQIQFNGGKNNLQLMKRQLKDNFNLNRLKDSIYQVRGYYDKNKNVIYIPAGILQTPFYQQNIPSYVNYGALGGIIANEMIRGLGFTDSLTNDDKNLSVWWSSTSKEQYESKTKCVEHHLSGLRINGLKLKGALVAQESITDIGGLNAAVQAYKKHEKSNGQGQALPGLELSNMQTLFLSFGQTFCSKRTRESANLLLNEGFRGTEEFRLKMALRNTIEFSTAFQCIKDTRTLLKDKCKVW